MVGWGIHTRRHHQLKLCIDLWMRFTWFAAFHTFESWPQPRRQGEQRIYTNQSDQYGVFLNTQLDNHISQNDTLPTMLNTVSTIQLKQLPWTPFYHLPENLIPCPIHTIYTYVGSVQGQTHNIKWAFTSFPFCMEHRDPSATATNTHSKSWANLVHRIVLVSVKSSLHYAIRQHLKQVYKPKLRNSVSCFPSPLTKKWTAVNS